MSAGAASTDQTPAGYSKNDFFVSAATTQDDYEQIIFTNSLNEAFLSGAQIIVCDSANSLDFSYDGVNLHGTLNENESATFDYRARSCIFVKPTSAGNNATYRIMAW